MLSIQRTVDVSKSVLDLYVCMYESGTAAGLTLCVGVVRHHKTVLQQLPTVRPVADGSVVVSTELVTGEPVLYLPAPEVSHGEHSRSV